MLPSWLLWFIYVNVLLNCWPILLTDRFMCCCCTCRVEEGVTLTTSPAATPAGLLMTPPPYREYDAGFGTATGPLFDCGNKNCAAGAKNNICLIEVGPVIGLHARQQPLPWDSLLALGSNKSFTKRWAQHVALRACVRATCCLTHVSNVCAIRLNRRLD